MEIKKMNKKGQSKGPTLFRIFVSLIIMLGVFAGLFAFYFSAIKYSTGAMPHELNASYTNITQSIDTMSDLSEEVRDEALKIEDFFSVETGLATIKGFTNTISLFGEMINVGTNSVGYFLLATVGLDIPGWAIALITISIIVITIVAVLKAVSGRTEV